MVNDESIPYLDKVQAIKASFFKSLLHLCPNLKSGVTDSNLRAHINKELAIKHPSIPIMYDKVCLGTINPSQYSEEEQAILRYFEELMYV